MENRLEVQEIQRDELYIELTPEELKELEQLKGGFSLSRFDVQSFTNSLYVRPLINGVPAFYLRGFSF